MAGELRAIRGSFENPKAFLHHIAEDEEIVSFAIVTFRKDGSIATGHLNCTHAELAFAGAHMIRAATEGSV